MDYKETTNRLGNSRIIKIAIIGVSVLLLIRGLSYILAMWVVRQIVMIDQTAVEKIIALQRIAELLLGVSVVGAIGTIITAVIARYGAREATRNIGEGLGKGQK
jgi:hypothetical protein